VLVPIHPPPIITTSEVDFMMTSKAQGTATVLTLAQRGHFGFLSVDQHCHAFYYQEFTLMHNPLTVNDDNLRVR